MLRHDGNLVAIHTQDFALKVDQLSLTYLHIISCLEIVLSLLTWKKNYNNNYNYKKFFVIHSAKMYEQKDCSELKKKKKEVVSW